MHPNHIENSVLLCHWWVKGSYTKQFLTAFNRDTMTNVILLDLLPVAEVVRVLFPVHSGWMLWIRDYLSPLRWNAMDPILFEYTPVECYESEIIRGRSKVTGTVDHNWVGLVVQSTLLYLNCINTSWCDHTCGTINPKFSAFSDTNVLLNRTLWIPLDLYSRSTVPATISASPKV